MAEKMGIQPLLNGQNPTPPNWGATVVLSLTAHPVGYHHFAMIEIALRAFPELKHVVLHFSNGIHPDPTKPPVGVPAKVRLKLLQQAAQAIAHPEQSFLAHQAQLAGEKLTLDPAQIWLSTLELEEPRAFTSQEVVKALLSQAHPAPERLFWLAGADLAQRMADPAIFRDEDLDVLAWHCTYVLLEREGSDLPLALQALQNRGVQLAHRQLEWASVPAWLLPFFSLSSTFIRQAAAAGWPLAGMLPAPAAAELAQIPGYATDSVAQTALAQEIQTAQAELDAAATEVLGLLQRQKTPLTVAVAEAGSGGALAASLGGVAGISRYLLQGRLVYDEASKEALLTEGKQAAPRNAGAVEEEMAAALAQAMRQVAGSQLALAETGVAGPPDGTRKSLKNGSSVVALAHPNGVEVQTLSLPAYLSRQEHQRRFALAALRLLAGWLQFQPHH